MQGQAGVGVNQCQKWIVEQEANEQQTEYSLRTREMVSWLCRSPGSAGHTQVTRLMRGMLVVKGCFGNSGVLDNKHDTADLRVAVVTLGQKLKVNTDIASEDRGEFWPRRPWSGSRKARFEAAQWWLRGWPKMLCRVRNQ